MKKLLLILSPTDRTASGNYAQTPHPSNECLNLLTVKKIQTMLLLISISVQLTSAQKTISSNSQADSYSFYIRRVAIGDVVYANHNNRIFTGSLSSNKATKFALFGEVMALTSIPFLISAGRNKKIAFLSLIKERVVIGPPSHTRFSYPAIAFTIKL